eukprot:GHVT01006638.1.p1 GENE.GHVT01006638.1~~GHVT01006638.1.p1  ORF type:complete len:105 (+),score=11.62 GHVT01006638.1:105-419(+)
MQLPNKEPPTRVGGRRCSRRYSGRLRATPELEVKVENVQQTKENSHKNVLDCFQLSPRRASVGRSNRRDFTRMNKEFDKSPPKMNFHIQQPPTPAKRMNMKVVR